MRTYNRRSSSSILYRWLFGMPMFRSHHHENDWDAFWSRDDDGKSGWLRRSGKYRAVVRVVVEAVAGLSAVAAWRYPHQFVLGFLSFGLLIVVVGILAAVRFGVNFRHERFERRPLYRKLAGRIKGLPKVPDKKTWQMARDRSSMRLELPADLDVKPTEKRAIASIVESHTGRDYDASWNVDSRPPHVTFRIRPYPPAKYRLDDVREHVMNLGPTQLMLGLNGKSQPDVWDFAAGAPHLMFSIRTGGAKSTAIRFLINQLLMKDADIGVTIVDVDGTSSEAFRGVEGVHVARPAGRDFRPCLDGVRRVYDELERRRDLAERIGIEAMQAQVEPEFLFLEEGNLFTDLMGRWWAETKGGAEPARNGDNRPARCPVFGMLGEIAFAGRKYKIHWVAAYQSGRVAAIGPAGGSMQAGAMREQFANVLFAGSPNTWRSILEDQNAHMPRLPKDPDDPEQPRIGICIRYRMHTGSWDIVQFPCDNEAEGRREALAVAGGSTVPIRPTEPDRYSVRELSIDDGHGLIPMKHATIRKRQSTQRDRWAGLGVKGMDGVMRYSVLEAQGALGIVAGAPDPNETVDA